MEMQAAVGKRVLDEVEETSLEVSGARVSHGPTFFPRRHLVRYPATDLNVPSDVSHTPSPALPPLLDSQPPGPTPQTAEPRG